MSCALGVVNAQDDESKPSLVNAPISRIYTPTGFDDNDNAQVIVEGEFENTCFKVGPVRLKVNREDQVVQFQLMAIQYKGTCLQVKTPFIKTIDLGILPEGKYKVVSVGKSSEPAVLGIRHTESRMADDFLYAPVDAALIRNTEQGERRILTISGTLPNTCMKFGTDQNTIIAKQTTKDIIEVLPVVDMYEGACLDVMVPFTKAVVLPDDIPTGKYLIHIRTLNGQSYNRVDFVGQDPSVRRR